MSAWPAYRWIPEITRTRMTVTPPCHQETRHGGRTIGAGWSAWHGKSVSADLVLLPQTPTAQGRHAASCLPRLSSAPSASTSPSRSSGGWPPPEAGASTLPGSAAVRKTGTPHDTPRRTISGPALWVRRSGEATGSRFRRRRLTPCVGPVAPVSWVGFCCDGADAVDDVGGGVAADVAGVVGGGEGGPVLAVAVVREVAASGHVDRFGVLA